MQYFLHHAKGQHIGHQIFHCLGRMLCDRVQQTLHALAVKKVGQLTLEHFRQMRGDNRCRVNHRVTRKHGFLALTVGNPQGRQVKGRLARFNAADLGGHVAGIHGQKVIDQNFCRSHLIALDKQGVLAGLELKVIAQVQRGDDHAHVQRELSAYGADAGQQVAALFFVHQRDEAVAHFKFKCIKGQQCLNLFRRVGSA